MNHKKKETHKDKQNLVKSTLNILTIFIQLKHIVLLLAGPSSDLMAGRRGSGPMLDNGGAFSLTSYPQHHQPHHQPFSFEHEVCKADIQVRDHISKNGLIFNPPPPSVTHL